MWITITITRTRTIIIIITMTNTDDIVSGRHERQNSVPQSSCCGHVSLSFYMYISFIIYSVIYLSKHKFLFGWTYISLRDLRPPHVIVDEDCYCYCYCSGLFYSWSTCQQLPPHGVFLETWLQAQSILRLFGKFKWSEYFWHKKNKEYF